MLQECLGFARKLTRRRAVLAWLVLQTWVFKWSLQVTPLATQEWTHLRMMMMAVAPCTHSDDHRIAALDFCVSTIHCTKESSVWYCVCSLAFSLLSVFLRGSNEVIVTCYHHSSLKWFNAWGNFILPIIKLDPQRCLQSFKIVCFAAWWSHFNAILKTKF